jgi:hypothetical protein
MGDTEYSSAVQKKIHQNQNSVCSAAKNGSSLVLLHAAQEQGRKRTF